MKIDIKEKIDLHSEIFSYFSEMIVRLTERLKSFIVSRWRTHLLRCKIKAERLALAKLSDRELADVGIDSADAMAESRRAFKDLPNNR